jgi:hypothetical protein
MTKKRRRIDKAAWEVTIDRLRADLEAEKLKNRRLINEKNAELERVWRLVPGYKLNLMVFYPALRRLFAILAEAADLTDPARGAPLEDTMRTEYTPDGETLTPTERAVFTHWRHRSDVVEANRRLQQDADKLLNQMTDELSRLIPGAEIVYNPPDGECAECGRMLFQNDTGRKREYCGAKCRQRASRKEKV